MSRTYIRIFTGSSIFSNRLKSLLHDNDINAIIKDHQESARLAGFGAPLNSSEVLVADSDLKNALEITKNFQKQIDSPI